MRWPGTASPDTGGDTGPGPGRPAPGSTPCTSNTRSAASPCARGSAGVRDVQRDCKQILQTHQVGAWFRAAAREPIHLHVGHTGASRGPTRPVSLGGMSQEARQSSENERTLLASPELLRPELQRGGQRPLARYLARRGVRHRKRDRRRRHGRLYQARHLQARAPFCGEGDPPPALAARRPARALRARGARDESRAQRSCRRYYRPRSGPGRAHVHRQRVSRRARSRRPPWMRVASSRRQKRSAGPAVSTRSGSGARAGRGAP